MKKSSKIILSVLVVAIVLCVVYRLVNKAPSANLESNAQMEEIIESSGCIACHSANPELPFSLGLSFFRHDSDGRGIEEGRKDQ